MRTIVIAFLLALTAATAAAQDRGAPRRERPLAPDTSYNFEDESVLGDRVSPYGDLLQGRRRRARQTLIRPRVHFVPEMMKSVENL